MSELDPTLIEHALAEDRAALARSLAELTERFAPARLVADGKSAMRAQAMPILDTVDGAISARPVTAAVAGIALAVLFLGRRRETPATPPAPALAGTRFEALTRWEDEGGPALPDPVDEGEDWLDEAVALNEKASGLFRRIDDAARRRLAPIGELAAYRAEVAAALARDTAAALGRGLEGLGGAARENALRLREAAYHRRLALGDRAVAAVREQPFGSALALAAAGAVTALCLPPTKTEDRLLGEARDRLLADLKRSLWREAAEASAFLRTLRAALMDDVALTRQMAGRPVSGPDRPDGAGWRH